jgi:hypothetical protein
LKEFNQRSEARPDSAILHAFLCNAYAYKGDYKHAIDECKKELVIEGHAESAARIERSYQESGFKGANQDYLNKLKRAAANEYVRLCVSLALRPAQDATRRQFITSSLRFNSAIRSSFTSSIIQRSILFVPTRPFPPSPQKCTCPAELITSGSRTLRQLQPLRTAT